MVQVEAVPIRRDALPPSIQEALDPSTPGERRLLLARAVIPLGPAELVAALACLLDDRSDTVSAAARKTLSELPSGVLAAGIAETTEPGVLDRLARELLSPAGAKTARDDAISRILANPAAADQTFAFVASRGSGPLLDQVAGAQVRLARFPKIIEAIYYNPEARMGLVSAVLEFAVRAEIDLSHIPGYQEIIESIFGPRKARPPEAPAPEETRIAEAGAGVPVHEVEAGGGLDQALADALAAGVEAPGLEEALDDENFALLLQAASWEEGPEDEEDGRDEDRRAAWAKVSRLSIPQKVRMALMGNTFVRSILIRDSRRVVYLAVLKSPSTSEKEIIAFAKDRALNEEIIRTIASNREWTKLYAVRHALVQNPKCPPVVALNFLKTLTAKDIRHLSTSHDVPGYVARQAKQILHAREMGPPR